MCGGLGGNRCRASILHKQHKQGRDRPHTHTHFAPAPPHHTLARHAPCTQTPRNECRTVRPGRRRASEVMGTRVTHGAAPCTLMQCSNDASQCRCTRAVAHRGARCNPVHHHRDAPRCRCTQVEVHRGARCTTVHGGAKDHQIVSQNPSSTGLDFRV